MAGRSMTRSRGSPTRLGYDALPISVAPPGFIRCFRCKTVDPAVSGLRGGRGARRACGGDARDRERRDEHRRLGVRFVAHVTGDASRDREEVTLAERGLGAGGRGVPRGPAAGVDEHVGGDGPDQGTALDCGQRRVRLPVEVEARPGLEPETLSLDTSLEAMMMPARGSAAVLPPGHRTLGRQVGRAPTVLGRRHRRDRAEGLTGRNETLLAHPPPDISSSPASLGTRGDHTTRVRSCPGIGVSGASAESAANALEGRRHVRRRVHGDRPLDPVINAPGSSRLNGSSPCSARA